MIGSSQRLAGWGGRRLVVGLAITATIFASCGNGPAANQATSSVAGATSAPSSGGAASSGPSAAGCPVAPCDQPIVIGVSQALTGDKSDPGTGIEHGYQVWVKEVNDAGGLLGRKVQLKEYDNQSLADTAVSQYERLVNQDKANFLFGPFSSALTIPTSAVAEKYHMAFIEGAGGAPGVFKRKFHYVFFVQPATADHQADPFVNYILSLPANQRPKTAAYPQQDDPFVSATENGAQAKLEAAGIRTVYKQVYPPTQTDFSSIAAAIKNANPDVVLGGTIFDDATGLVKAFAAINYNPKALYFTSGPGTVGAFKQALGNKVNGIMTGDSWIEASKDPGNDKFVAEYHAMFPKEKEIPAEAAEGYSVGEVLQAAVQGTQSLDNTKIDQWLHSNKVQTVQGQIGWDDLGRPTGSFLLEQFQNNTLDIVAPAGDPNKNGDPVFPKPNW